MDACCHAVLLPVPCWEAVNAACVLRGAHGVQIWRPTTFMRHMTASAPGIVDFLTILEVLRSRHKPQEKVLDLATTYVSTAVTPRTMNAIAEGHMDVRPLPAGPRSRNYTLSPCAPAALSSPSAFELCWW